MPKQVFALEPNGPKRLEISWHGFWKDMRVTLDGNPLGTVPDQQALREGRTFPLPDGSTLKLQLVRAFSSVEFHITRNGRPLPGSVGHPASKLRNAYIMLYIIGGLNIVLGTLTQLIGIEYFLRLGIGIFSIIFGAVLALLGFLVQKKIVIALVLALIVLAADAVLGLVAAFLEGYQPSAAGIALRVIYMLPLFPAFKAIRELKRSETSTPPPDPAQ